MNGWWSTLRRLGGIGLLLLIALVGCSGQPDASVSPTDTAEPVELTRTAVPVEDATLDEVPEQAPVHPEGTAALVAGSTSVTTGETVEVSVYLTEMPGLLGAEVQLRFDPAMMRPVDADPEKGGVQVEHGDVLVPDFVALNSVDAEVGIIRYAVSQSGAAEVGADAGDLLIAYLQGSAAGETEISIASLTLADADGREIPVTLNPAVVTLEID